MKEASVLINRKNFTGKRNSKCKGCVSARYLASPRNGAEAGAEKSESEENGRMRSRVTMTRSLRALNTMKILDFTHSKMGGKQGKPFSRGVTQPGFYF